MKKKIFRKGYYWHNKLMEEVSKLKELYKPSDIDREEYKRRFLEAKKNFKPDQHERLYYDIFGVELKI